MKNTQIGHVSPKGGADRKESKMRVGMTPAGTNPEGRVTLSWRIGLPQWETDAAFGKLLSLLGEYRSVVDEVCLFDSITHHLYIPLDNYARRMEVAAGRLDALRRAGVGSAGIKVLCTIGHINEAWDYMPPLPFQAMVGHDGSVSTGCACPNTPEMRAYVRAKYELVARARPDFIWVDDDIRMHHHGVAWGCFCPTCLAQFAERAGGPFTREELVDLRIGFIRRLGRRGLRVLRAGRQPALRLEVAARVDRKDLLQLAGAGRVVRAQ